MGDAFVFHSYFCLFLFLFSGITMKKAKEQ